MTRGEKVSKTSLPVLRDPVPFVGEQELPSKLTCLHHLSILSLPSFWLPGAFQCPKSKRSTYRTRSCSPFFSNTVIPLASSAKEALAAGVLKSMATKPVLSLRST